MTASLALLSPDIVKRRVMVALELVDPITGRLAGADMRVSGPGFAAPSVTRAGQIVWTDPQPPLDPADPAPPPDRQLAIEAIARHGQFAPYSRTLTLPVRLKDVPPPVYRDTLVPTGLYQAPPGRLAAAGMLIDAAASRQPVAGAKVRIWLQSRNDAAALDSNYQAISDTRGGFVAVVGDLAGDASMPQKAPAPDGAVIGWIAFTVGATTRHSLLLPLRRGRLFQAPAPFVWAALAAAPPALPAP
jgi:hypothetical protein